jgi:hypothetical protein
MHHHHTSALLQQGWQQVLRQRKVPQKVGCVVQLKTLQSKENQEKKAPISVTVQLGNWGARRK